MIHFALIPVIGLLVTAASPSFADQDALREAGINAAVAAKCRAQLGDERLFDVAFQQFEDVALGMDPAPSPSEISDFRNQLSSLPAAEPDDVTVVLCQRLRVFLLPD